MTRWLIAATAFAVASCGRGGGGGESLDCAWVSSDNCWKRFVTDVGSCVPDEAASGTFDATGSTCAYADGSRVDFDVPVPRSVPDDFIWRFTLHGPSGECLRYDEASDEPGRTSLTITSGDQVFRAEGTMNGFTATCPDGTTVFTSDPMSVVTDCGAWWGLPSITIQESPSRIGLEIIIDEEEGGADVGVRLFSCEWPAE